MKVKYEFADGTIMEVEVEDELGNVINESRKQEENLERRERYHCRVSFDSLEFEGELFSDESNSPERLAVETEEQEWVEAFLTELTEVQRRRIEQLMDGITIAEIARNEGTSFNTIKDCIKGVEKKLKKFLK